MKTEVNSRSSTQKDADGQKLSYFEKTGKDSFILTPSYRSGAATLAHTVVQMHPPQWVKTIREHAERGQA